MSDGAMCHFCWRYDCACEPSCKAALVEAALVGDGAFARTVGMDDMAWLEKHGPFRILVRAAGIQEICDRRGTPLVIACAGPGSRSTMEHWVLRANMILLQSATHALLQRLEEVEPAINNAFMMGYIHGQTYDGPNYGKELAAVRRLV